MIGVFLVFVFNDLILKNICEDRFVGDCGVRI